MNYLINGPDRAKKTIIFTHGKGSPVHSPWFHQVAERLAEEKIRVIRFNFPFIFGPDETIPSDKKLQQIWQEVIDSFNHSRTTLFIGGRSHGARMASHIADRNKIGGLLCFSFPFHGQEDDSEQRTEHLKNLKTPSLIVQGEKDCYGSKEEVLQYNLSSQIEFLWLEEQEHILSPLEEQSFQQIISFIQNH